MPLNTLEIAQVGAIFAGILLLFVLVGGLKARSWLQLKENKLRWEFEERVKGFRSEAQEAIGGAIGRFMQNLTQQAEEEGGVEGSTTGQIKLGGFEIDIGTIKELIPIIPQVIQLAQMFGLVKGGTGGGENPFV